MASRIGRRESQQFFFSAGVVLKKRAKILKKVFSFLTGKAQNGVVENCLFVSYFATHELPKATR